MGFIILIMPHLFTSSLRLLELRRLRWRARRGRLENDLIFERFFSRYETALDGSPSIELPVYKGTVGPDVIDIRKLYAQMGRFTYDPGFMSTASCKSAIT